MIESSISRLARRQHGLVTRSQARDVVARHTLERRLRAQRLAPVRRCVYRVARAPHTWAQHLLAACFAAGPEACVSFRSAAAIRTLEGFDRSGLEITLRPSP